jgi:serine/threonine protein kinase
MKWPDNPFPFGTPVPKDELFMDRHNELRRLVEAVSNTEMAVVVLEGPRRIGKSSLLKRFYRQIEANVISAELDLQGLLIAHGTPVAPELAAQEILFNLGLMLCKRAGIRESREMMQTSSDFYGLFLAPVLRSSQSRRVVVMLDEFDILDEMYPGAIEEILSAFRLKFTPQPLVVCCCGRRLGVPRSDRLAYLLKAALSIHLAPFDEATTKAAPDLAITYSFSASALDAFWTLTRGHPLWMNALNHYIYAERHQTKNSTKVEAAEVQQALPEASRWFTNPIWNAWRQLSPIQSLFARAVADLTWQREDSSFAGTADLTQIESELRPYFSRIEHDHLRRSADSLVDNYLLSKEGEGYALHAPFLGYWLRQQNLSDLRLVGDPGALKHVTDARNYRAKGDITSAMVALNDAIYLDPTNTDALLMAAELATEKGDLDRAIWHLEAASRSQPQIVNVRLREVLINRIEKTHQEGESPDPWYYKLRELISEVEANSPSIIRILCDYHLRRWANHIKAGNTDAAHSILEDFANRSLPGWLDSTASAYVDLMRSLPYTEEGLVRSVFMVRQEFVILTESHIPPIHPEDSEFETQLLTRFVSNPEVQNQIRQHFDEYADRYPWWTVTLSVIERALRTGNPGKLDWVPSSILEKVVYRAPHPYRQKLLETVRMLLPPRLADMVDKDPRELSSAIRLLFLAPQDSVSSVHSILEETLASHAVRVAERSDDDVVFYFREAPRIYLIWVEYLSGEDRQTANILDHFDLLLERMREPVGPAPPDSREWELFVRAGDAMTAWQDLLAHPLLRSDRASSLKKALQPPDFIEDAIRASAVAAPPEWEQSVKSQLDSRYQNVRLLDISLPGIPTAMVKFYRAVWGGEEVNLKVYRVPAETQSRDLLTYLWEKEKRALINLSTRVSGRGLTRFKFSERIPGERGGEYLVIVTEPAGRRTLRDQLKSGRTGILSMDRRQELWQAIHLLIESVSALHRTHYLHRSIRPENIFVQDSDDAPFKLGNFEWSLYLHSLADEFPKEDRWVDRYAAPEVLTGRFRKKGADAGEGFSSEVYSLGLVLFELLVRRLNEDEIGRFHGPSDYDPEAHRNWLHQLRKEIRDTLKGNELKDQRLLLLEMLEPSVALRRSNLDDLVELTASIAWDFKEIDSLLLTQKPYVVAALSRGAPYSIERFLKPLVKLDELGNGESTIADLIQREISGARVYRNSNPDQPLLIEGRRILFAATPFAHRYGKRDAEIRFVSEVPFLTVANILDRREGAPIARLPYGLPVVDLSTAHRDLERSQRRVAQRGEGWRRLFELAMAGVDRLPQRSREFHTILQVTAEVEERLWKQLVSPYRVVSKHTEADRIAVIIRRTDDLWQEAQPADRMVAQQAARGERFFELSRSNNPLAPLLPISIWKLERVDTVAGTVQLSRENGEWPPEDGFLRPQALAGNRAIRKRRTEALFNLRDDEYLLKAVTDIADIQEEWPDRDAKYFDQELDNDKRRIIHRILTTPPLYLVQGPPGTGKTTLAAEVIRQVLHKNPAARILITSQSHEPLNNLLLRVEKAFENVASDQKPSAVRILSSTRLQSRRWTKETTQVMKEFQPSEVARRHIEFARKWQPSAESGIDMELLKRWRAWIEANSKNLPVELERKIIASANLVYATANDKSIANVPEHREFDLLIFEEAAKAYPLEVLGPMRLSRRWLLIGDHEQLSAFNIEEFRREAESAISHLYETVSGPVVKDQKPHAMGLLASSSGLAVEVADFFEFLYRKGVKPSSGKAYADRLTLQWRMHPEISRMLRKIYYDFLKDGDVSFLTARHRHRISYPQDFRRNPMIWIDTPVAGDKSNLEWGHLASEVPVPGGGFRNPFEVRVLQNVLNKIQVSGRGGLAGNVAFLSPYRAQVDLINYALRSWDAQRNPQTGDLRQKAYTVDSFQGRQAEVVFISLVRNNQATEGFEAYGFLEGDVGRARSAVMFSRAERLIIIIGCSKHFQKQSEFHIGSVFEFIQENGLVINAKEFLKEKT